MEPILIAAIESIDKIYKMRERTAAEADYHREIMEVLETAAADPNLGWIKCKDAMPIERESIFAKFYGTDKWRSGMFRTISNEVNVTVMYEDGTCVSTHMHTADGKWSDPSRRGKFVVLAWRPFPDSFQLR